jgi:hypothetical protein
LSPGVDLGIVERHLAIFRAIALGSPEGGPIAALPQPDRFHWLVAPRSTMIQTSPTHVGRAPDADAALEGLLAEFVRVPSAEVVSAARNVRDAR